MCVCVCVCVYVYVYVFVNILYIHAHTLSHIKGMEGTMCALITRINNNVCV